MKRVRTSKVLITRHENNSSRRLLIECKGHEVDNDHLVRDFLAPVVRGVDDADPAALQLAADMRRPPCALERGLHVGLDGDEVTIRVGERSEGRDDRER